DSSPRFEPSRPVGRSLANSDSVQEGFMADEVSVQDPPRAHPLERFKGAFCVILVLGGSALALYTGARAPFQPPIQRNLFLLILLPLLFLRVPSGFFKSGVRETSFGLLLSALTIFVTGWYIHDFERLAFDPFISTFDVAVGIIGLLLVLESVRRTAGLALTI